jgi:ABC-type Fe3+-hydroxamate transport system substrate-binding protein
MGRQIGAIILCLLTLPAFCQSTSKYQVATILEVNPRQAAGDHTSEATSYDISVKVGDRIYVVLYATPLGEVAPKYAAGRELLVLVGKNTITYNDMLGRSLEVPITSQRLATGPKNSK